VQAEYLTVDEVFTSPGTTYVIPIYQRNYAWGVEQIEQLVDDVWTAARDADAAHYFLGNLVVAQRWAGEDEVGARRLEVIDGQQRLTTLSLLLGALSAEPPPGPARVRLASEGERRPLRPWRSGRGGRHRDPHGLQGRAPGARVAGGRPSTRSASRPF